MVFYKNFEGWEVRHLYKRAKTFGLSDEFQETLSHTGWKLAREKKLTKTEVEKLENALSRIGTIPKLGKTCNRKNCEVCSKVTELVPGDGDEKKETWSLNLELWRWQKECTQKWWKNGGEGIVKVVTGAGKTVLALALMENLSNKEVYESGGLKTVIITPTTALLDQWFGELLDTLSVPKKDIGFFYGDQKNKIKDNKAMLYVINSAREHLGEHLEQIDDDVFLIADECHRYASQENSKIFQNHFDYKLGLSATPERKLDYGFEKILVPNLGKIIYEYGYSEARDDGIIPPYYLKRLEIPLTSKEQKRYKNLTDKIRKTTQVLRKKYDELEEVEGDEFFKKLGELSNRYDDGLFDRFTSLANKRKAIVHESKSKMAALKYIIEKDMPLNSRTLIFHERTQIADRINEYLQSEGFSSVRYHSNMDGEKRRENLLKYKRMRSDFLVSCRALDEGLDVPATNVGIIVAATSSVRQRIQRTGRILRRAPGKDYSIIYTIYVSNVEEEIFNKKAMKDLEDTAVRVENIKLEV
ncbi:hypothetical protein AKJ36_00070 [candidate division MSBL1 archaeon SCGC-AAA259I07]|uniref:Helicase n=1 Tax=candidate division MSBL1 archaeon SCGC-AAA259I07 TaxID=1698266 RepID=A0A133UN47_9EURY|nr:hypothetical protein AKJ36_00070 [candidate division MSBL1 archaeon SCGC-AAA259I07]